MMYADSIYACIHAYNLRILNKLSVVVNNYNSMTINHAVRWASDEDHHII